MNNLGSIASNFGIFLNPFHHLLTEAQTAQLILFDLSGGAIYTTGDIPMSKGQNEFVVQDLSDGLYFARLNLEDRSINARVTVLH